MALAASGSLGGFVDRSVALDAEYKAKSSALADACVDTLLLRLREDAAYRGGEAVAVGSDSCRILPSAGSDPRVFDIQAIYNRAYTNLEVTVDVSTLAVRSLLEVPTL